MRAPGSVPHLDAPPVGHGDDGAPLSLPPRPVPPRPPGIPWLATATPVVGALGFWAVTGSVFVLWFALLGPVIAVASVVDGARATRRERRASDRDAERARARIRERVAARHEAERAALDARHPDVAGYLARPDQIWRAPAEGEPVLVVGRGRVTSSTRLGGAADHPEDLALAADARTLADAPVAVPLRTGVAVVGPAPIARAVLRALVLQLALARPPGQWHLIAVPGGEEWATTLPHAARAEGRRVHWVSGARGVDDVDLVLRDVRPGEVVPADCSLIVELAGPARARLQAPGLTADIVVEALAGAQASRVAQELAARVPEDTGGGAVALTELRPRGRTRSRESLAVDLARGASGSFAVDLVQDGPHAVVTGMTGAGKSELLVTWVTALCARYSTADVSFLLADFKGGTAFSRLVDVPHVTGVLTDLDGRGATRALASLRAEVRTREEALARAGERDIAATDLPRLVIVVDEFAALREAHPDLEALFADLAARGRALGMHLILGTQRAPGVLRESLLANCPLRVSLRVADASDSAAVVGAPDAAALPGGADGRGLAVIRRAADPRPVRVRVALTGAADIAAAADGAGPRPRATWLPELPARIALGDVPPTGGIVLGVRDEPHLQRRTTWAMPPTEFGVLVVGGPGSGKSTMLRTVAAQVPHAVRVGADPEQAWDVLAAAALCPPDPGTVLLLDDLDALAARYPDEYAAAITAAVEGLVRDAGSLGLRVVASAQRLSAIAGRVADLFPRRVLLRMPGRSEHVAAGGDAADYAPDLPPGRGVADRAVVQVAIAPAAEPDPPPVVPLWHPPPGLSGYVVPRRGSGALERFERAGVRVRAVDAADDPAALEPGGAVLLVGDAEQWMSRPRLLERVRASHLLAVDAACRRDVRLLTGDRDLPPYADPVRGRAWIFSARAEPRRVAITPSAAGARS